MDKLSLKLRKLKQIILFYPFAILICTFGCVREPEPPEYIIPQRIMVEAMVEFHLLDANVSRMNFIDLDSAKVAFHYYEKEIYKKYGVDSVQYAQSYQFYGEHPELMLKIYQEVSTKLEVKKDSIYQTKMTKPSKPIQSAR